MLLLARIIEMDGDVYLPLYERLEKELAVVRHADGLRQRARDFLEANRHKLPLNARGKN